jgi:hypothetical protein
VKGLHGHEGLLTRMAGTGADLASEPELMSATDVRRTPGAAEYGRHAAPPSAYGPSDIHRLLPAAPIGARARRRTGSGDAPVEVVDFAVRAEVAPSDGADDRTTGEVSRSTGLLARLRLLPRAA